MKSARVVVLLFALVLALLPASAFSTTDDESAVIRGTIRTADGTPLNSGEVTARPVSGTSGVVRSAQTHRGPGEYELTRLRSGSYYLTFWDGDGDHSWAYYPGTRKFAAAKIVTVKAGQVVEDIDIALEPGAGGISGSVQYPAGSDLSNTHAHLIAYYLDDDTWRRVATGLGTSSPARPTFTVGGLPAGTYRLRYESSGGSHGTASGFLGGTDDAASSTPVEVVAGRSTPITFTPRRAGRITGRVVDPAGDPVADVRVAASTKIFDLEYPSNYSWRSGGAVTTDADGRYELTDLDTGSYVIGFEPPEPFQEMNSGGSFRHYAVKRGQVPSANPDAAKVEVTAGQTTRWHDETLRRGGTLEGVVRDPHGDPAPGVVVEIQRGYGYGVLPGTTNWDTNWRRTTADANGHYSFDPLPNGVYRLRFTDPDGHFRDTAYENRDYWKTYRSFDFLDCVFPLPGTNTVADGGPAARAPSVTDTSPVVGQSLRSDLTINGTKLSTDPDAVWTWRRNGDVIAEATGSTYRPTAADRGKRLTVTVTSKRRGSQITHVTEPTAAVARSRPRLHVTARSPRPGRVELRIKATARAVPSNLLDGRITIGRVRGGSDHLTTRTMRDGSLVVTLTRQPRGKRTYTASFLGVRDRYATSRTVRASVTVR